MPVAFLSRPSHEHELGRPVDELVHIYIEMGFGKSRIVLIKGINYAKLVHFLNAGYQANSVSTPPTLSKVELNHG